MSAEPKNAFKAVVDTYETWRNKRDISRQQRAAALGALSTFIRAMGWTSSVQDELEERSRGRR